MIALRPAVTADAAPLIAALSEFDQAVIAELTPDPAALLATAIGGSAYTMRVGTADHPMCIFGCYPHGGVWMLATPLVAHHRKFYLRESRRQIAAMRARFGRLHTTVDVRYPRSLRWLAWLGFAIGDPAPGRRGNTIRRVELVNVH